MKSIVTFCFAAIIMVALLAGCGKVPQAQIDEVNAAIESARDSEAGVYVPSEFTALQDSMKAIMVDVEAQKSKLFKKFGLVEEKLTATLEAADAVKTAAVAKKEEVKSKVEALLNDINGVIEENARLFPKAPRGKEGTAVLEQMKTEMTTVEGSVAEAKALYDKGAYMDAYNKISAASETANKINTELKDAIKKAGGRI